MSKRFDEWNETKKLVESNDRKVGIKPRELFWVKIGQNIGSEEYGKGENFTRPVIIIRKLTYDLFLGVPTTTTAKHDDYFHTFEYNYESKGIVKASAMILQVKVFSIKRLMNRIGIVDKENFKMIQEKIKGLIGPT
jgi:mRNA interferase MazF